MTLTVNVSDEFRKFTGRNNLPNEGEPMRFQTKKLTIKFTADHVYQYKGVLFNFYIGEIFNSHMVECLSNLLIKYHCT